MKNIIPVEWLVILLGIFSFLAVPFLQNQSQAIQISDNATLQQYWGGQAELKLYKKLDYEYRNATQIKVVDGVWYLFYRGGKNISSGCDAWLTASLDTRVVRSVDQGQTWSAPVIAVANELGTPWECAANDGDAYYDKDENKWHLLVQCATPDRKWHACHFVKDGKDPMGQFAPQGPNPVLSGNDLWRDICNSPNDECYQLARGNNVSESGTFDIFQKKNGYYYVSFHGAYNDNGRGLGFRGIGKTKDFVNWEAGSGDLPTDSIFDANDSAVWKEDWQGYNAAGGAGEIIYDNGYYYLFVEAAAQGINCIVGQHWDAGILRSQSLSNNHWEQFPQGNPIVYSHRTPGKQTSPCPLQYVGIFKDDVTGKIYTHYSQQDEDINLRGVYVAELLKVPSAAGASETLPVVNTNPVQAPILQPTPTSIPNNPQAGICTQGQTFYSCSDIRCPDGSTPPGGGCYPNSYVQDCLKNCSLPTPAPVAIYNTPYSTPASAPIQSTVYPSPYTNPTPIGGVCRDDCFSDDLRTNVGINPANGQCSSGYQSVSHFCGGGNVGATQYCNGAPFRCVQSGQIYYWDSNY